MTPINTDADNQYSEKERERYKALVFSDYAQLLRLSDGIEKASRETGIDGSILAGFISKMSRAGKRLYVRGFGPQEKWGVMQVNSHKFIPNGSPYSYLNIKQGAQILRNNREAVMKKFPSWDNVQTLKASIGLYELGDMNMLTSYNVIERDVRGIREFVNDIIQRAQIYKHLNFPKGVKVASSSKSAYGAAPMTVVMSQIKERVNTPSTTASSASRFGRPYGGRRPYGGKVRGQNVIILSTMIPSTPAPVKDALAYWGTPSITYGLVADMSKDDVARGKVVAYDETRTYGGNVYNFTALASAFSADHFKKKGELIFNYTRSILSNYLERVIRKITRKINLKRLRYKLSKGDYRAYQNVPFQNTSQTYVAIIFEFGRYQETAIIIFGAPDRSNNKPFVVMAPYIAVLGKKDKDDITNFFNKHSINKSNVMIIDLTVNKTIGYISDLITPIFNKLFKRVNMTTVMGVNDTSGNQTVTANGTITEMTTIVTMLQNATISGAVTLSANATISQTNNTSIATTIATASITVALNATVSDGVSSAANTTVSEISNATIQDITTSATVLQNISSTVAGSLSVSGISDNITATSATVGVSVSQNTSSATALVENVTNATLVAPTTVASVEFSTVQNGSLNASVSVAGNASLSSMTSATAVSVVEVQNATLSVTVENATVVSVSETSTVVIVKNVTNATLIASATIASVEITTAQTGTVNVSVSPTGNVTEIGNATVSGITLVTPVSVVETQNDTLGVTAASSIISEMSFTTTIVSDVTNATVIVATIAVPELTITPNATLNVSISVSENATLLGITSSATAASIVIVENNTLGVMMPTAAITGSSNISVAVSENITSLTSATVEISAPQNTTIPISVVTPASAVVSSVTNETIISSATAGGTELTTAINTLNIGVSVVNVTSTEVINTTPPSTTEGTFVSSVAENLTVPVSTVVSIQPTINLSSEVLVVQNVTITEATTPTSAPVSETPNVTIGTLVENVTSIIVFINETLSPATQPSVIPSNLITATPVTADISVSEQIMANVSVFVAVEITPAPASVSPTLPVNNISVSVPPELISTGSPPPNITEIMESIVGSTPDTSSPVNITETFTSGPILQNDTITTLPPDTVPVQASSASANQPTFILTTIPALPYSVNDFGTIKTVTNVSIAPPQPSPTTDSIAPTIEVVPEVSISEHVLITAGGIIPTAIITMSETTTNASVLPSFVTQSIIATSPASVSESEVITSASSSNTQVDFSALITNITTTPPSLITTSGLPISTLSATIYNVPYVESIVTRVATPLITSSQITPIITPQSAIIVSSSSISVTDVSSIPVSQSVVISSSSNATLQDVSTSPITSPSILPNLVNVSAAISLNASAQGSESAIPSLTSATQPLYEVVSSASSETPVSTQPLVSLQTAPLITTPTSATSSPVVVFESNISTTDIIQVPIVQNTPLTTLSESQLNASFTFPAVSGSSVQITSPPSTPESVNVSIIRMPQVSSVSEALTTSASPAIAVSRYSSSVNPTVGQPVTITSPTQVISSEISVSDTSFITPQSSDLSSVRPEIISSSLVTTLSPASIVVSYNSGDSSTVVIETGNEMANQTLSPAVSIVSDDSSLAGLTTISASSTLVTNPTVLTVSLVGEAVSNVESIGTVSSVPVSSAESTNIPVASQASVSPDSMMPAGTSIQEASVSPSQITMQPITVEAVGTSKIETITDSGMGISQPGISSPIPVQETTRQKETTVIETLGTDIAYIDTSTDEPVDMEMLSSHGDSKLTFSYIYELAFTTLTTGASNKTVKQFGLNVTGVAASEFLIEQDLLGLKSIAKVIKAISKISHIPPELLGALISQRSRVGLLLDANYMGEFGYGLFQIAISPKFPKYSPYSYFHIKYGAVTFHNYVVMIKQSYPIFTPIQILFGALVAFELQTLGVPSRQQIDNLSVNGDLAMDVMARARWLRRMGYPDLFINDGMNYPTPVFRPVTLCPTIPTSPVATILQSDTSSTPTPTSDAAAINPISTSLETIPDQAYATVNVQGHGPDTTVAIASIASEAEPFLIVSSVAPEIGSAVSDVSVTLNSADVVSKDAFSLEETTAGHLTNESPVTTVISFGHGPKETVYTKDHMIMYINVNNNPLHPSTGQNGEASSATPLNSDISLATSQPGNRESDTVSVPVYDLDASLNGPIEGLSILPENPKPVGYLHKFGRKGHHKNYYNYHINENTILNDIDPYSFPDLMQKKLKNRQSDYISNTLIREDVVLLGKYKENIARSTKSSGVDPALVAALISKGSRAGRDLDRSGYGWKYKNYGLMQINPKIYGIRGGPYSDEHIKQGVGIVKRYLKMVLNTDPSNMSKEDIVKATIALWEENQRYYKGKRSIKISHLLNSAKTKRFTDDVILRAIYLKRNQFFGTS